MSKTPFEEKECGECGSTERRCPECGERFVTPLEPEAGAPGMTVRQFVQQAEDGDEITFTNLCWKCPWEDKRTIRVTID